jgi:hypothetical protein
MFGCSKFEASLLNLSIPSSIQPLDWTHTTNWKWKKYVYTNQIETKHDIQTNCRQTQKNKDNKLPPRLLFHEPMSVSMSYIEYFKFISSIVDKIISNLFS